jgi:hypothetical protein
MAGRGVIHRNDYTAVHADGRIVDKVLEGVRMHP